MGDLYFSLFVLALCIVVIVVIVVMVSVVDDILLYDIKEYLKGKKRKFFKPIVDFYNKIFGSIKTNNNKYKVILFQYFKENKIMCIGFVIVTFANFVLTVCIQKSLRDAFIGINVEWWGVITEIIVLVMVLGSIERSNNKKLRIADTECKLWEEVRINAKNNEKILFLIRRINKEGSSPKNLTKVVFDDQNYSLKNDYEINNLSDVEFKDCVFEDINFSDIKMQNANFNNCEFHNCEFRKTDFTNSKFHQCHIEFKENSTPLIGTIFEKARFNNCEIYYFNAEGSLNFETTVFEDTCFGAEYNFPDIDLSEFRRKNNDEIRILLCDEEIEEKEFYKRKDFIEAFELLGGKRYWMDYKGKLHDI